jgi:hypothetical protein
MKTIEAKISNLAEKAKIHESTAAFLNELALVIDTYRDAKHNHPINAKLAGKIEFEWTLDEEALREIGKEDGFYFHEPSAFLPYSWVLLEDDQFRITLKTEQKEIIAVGYDGTKMAAKHFEFKIKS